MLVLLTEKWAACIPYLQLLCVAGLLFPLQLMNLNVLQALGRSDLFLRLEIIKKVLIVINIAVTWRWGISAMIYGMIVISIISYYLNSYYNGMLIDYSIGEQVRDVFSYLYRLCADGHCGLCGGVAAFPRPMVLACGADCYGDPCLCRTVPRISTECLYGDLESGAG